MIQMKGRIAIKTLKGTRGAFCVGELTTDVGVFKVKDQVLDQYEEGTYQGTFLVSQIYLASYTYYGRFNVELRAKIAEMDLEADGLNAGRSTKPVVTPTADPDPMDEATQGHSLPALSSAKNDVLTTTTSVSIDAKKLSTGDDAELFGGETFEVIERGEPVKLDPTIDRAVFRIQRDRLKAKGYSFDPTFQQWLLKAVSK